MKIKKNSDFFVNSTIKYRIVSYNKGLCEIQLPCQVLTYYSSTFVEGGHHESDL